ncbi:carbohydrate kinase family protein [Flectobacillus longus]|uniref:carbohydrate kinase family protein n=1 Tax=Flectobacillus longus TaxID=2984207 RepID=UPI0024B6948C|nr:carbohydrate kinase [Flectobacillus longus]MDI9879125.1 carbohydrate kinase [Flectobacillus longus]
MQRYICCFGEVLWDMLPSGKLPGGAPMNVATHLQNLGIPAKMISRVGKDDLGAEIKAFLESKNCTTEWIQDDEHLNTGWVKVQLSEKNEATYTIVHPVAWDFIQTNEATQQLVNQASALVFGTLASRDQTSYLTLLNILKNLPKDGQILKVFDINLRPPHYSKSLIEEFLQYADIVKLNEDELKIVSEWYEIKGSEENQLREISHKFNLKTLIVTKGGDGAILLKLEADGEKHFYQQQGYKVVVADTIGSGDSFLAGFLKNILDGKSSEYALNFACAIGAVVASHSGANPAITEADIEGMMVGVRR